MGSILIRLLINCRKKFRKVLLYGSGKENIKFYHDRPNKRYFAHRPFEGAIKQLERRWRETTSAAVRNDLIRYIDLSACDTCHGARLKKESPCRYSEWKKYL